MKASLWSSRDWAILAAALAILAAPASMAQAPAGGADSTPGSTPPPPSAQQTVPGKPAGTVGGSTGEKTAHPEKEKSHSSTSGSSSDAQFMAAAKKAIASKDKKAGAEADGAEGEDGDGDSGQPWNAKLVKFLSVAILAFGAAVLGMMTYLVMQNKDSGAVLRLFTVPLVIVASVFLVVAGFTNQQITPVVGLLGTIVGYILGSHSARNELAAANEAAREKAEDKAGQEKDTLPPTS